MTLANSFPSPAPTQTTGVVIGSNNLLLRIEGAVALAASVVGFRLAGGSWPLFAVLFLVPDVAMLGYLMNPTIGARIYNVGHTYVAPAVLALLSLALGQPLLLSLAAIWCAHIGFDRLMGYGLKYAASFKATHLSTA